MKKTNKSNPLKTFNDNKAMAYKKAGGEMAAFKKSLTKAQTGIAVNSQPMIGPKTEMQSIMSNVSNFQPPIPRANTPSISEMSRNRNLSDQERMDIYKSRPEPKGTYDEYKPKSISDAEKKYLEMKNSRGAKNGGPVKKVLKKAENGTSVGPSFGDKINLAAKRVSRNITNRKAVNQLQRSSKVFNSDRSKADALYNKAETTYNKAVDKNKAINKFKREQGFAPGGDGTYFGNNKYSKPGPIISKQKNGGPVKRKKK